MVPTLEEISRELDGAHAVMLRDQAARAADRERRCAAGFFAWLLDFIGLTAAASLQRASARAWKHVKKRATESTHAWVRARTIYLGTADVESAGTRAALQRRAQYVSQQLQRVQKVHELVDCACRNAQEAERECEIAARQRNWAGYTRSSGFVVVSNIRAGFARGAVDRAQQALNALQAELPKLELELRVKIPGAMLELLCHLDGGAGNRLLTFWRANQLYSASKHCAVAAAALGVIAAQIRPQLIRLQASHDGAARALEQYDAPYRRAALTELPADLRELLSELR